MTLVDDKGLAIDVTDELNSIIPVSGAVQCIIQSTVLVLDSHPKSRTVEVYGKVR